MHYDQSWMGYGLVGGLQAGGISALAGFVLFIVVRAFGRRNGWSPIRQWSIAFMLALALTASGDMWDLFYFNYGQVQSIKLLKAKMAQLHDPDNIGQRVFWELTGAAVGTFAAWLMVDKGWRQLFHS
jgi:uncharacterized protein YfiM (DUF2279 family)